MKARLRLLQNSKTLRRFQTFARLLAGALLLVLAACGTGNAGGETALSGFIEGHSYGVASEFGGQVAEVLVEAGEEVSAGQPLLQLDTTELEHLRDGAQAGVDAARAGLAALEAQPRQEEVDQAEAALEAAQANQAIAQAALDLLEASYDPFAPPDADLHAAEGALAVAEAGVKLAEAQLAQVKAGALPGEIEAAQAQLAGAQAQLALVDAQIERMQLKSPVDGVVNQVLVGRGEVASPGTPLVQVVDTEYLTLRVYLPQARVASINPGDEATITVDAYPDVAFNGAVSHVAQQAQFTPTNVQTREERVKLVFAVEIRIEDPSGKLKAGMPADADFGG